jgi:hypothetical protein
MSAETIENDTEHQAVDELQPIPDSIKYGAMGGAVLIVIIIAWFVFSSSGDDKDNSKVQALIDIEKPAQVEVLPELQIPINSSVPVDIPVNPVEEIKQASKVDIVDETDLPFVTQQSESKLKLIKFEEQLNQLVQDNNSRQQGQDQLIEELQSQLTAQSAQIDQLQSNIKARQSYAKRKNKKVARYKSVALPFTLVSVDQWGDDTYAVVRQYGRLYELTAGQSVDNSWHVQSIDRSRRIAVFKNSKGLRRELFVES